MNSPHGNKRAYHAHVVLVLLILVILWLAYLVFTYLKNNRVVNTKTETTTLLEQLPYSSLGDRYKWKSDSPYTIINYFSMDCPSCIRLDKIDNDFKDKYMPAFSLIYRHSPLPSEPFAAGKAVIAECVYDQSGDKGMFDFMSDMYDNYKKIATKNDLVAEIASKYVSNKNTFYLCIKGDEVKNRIIGYKKEALSYGVVGTPTIGVFRGGVLISRFNTISDVTAKRIMDNVTQLKK